MTFKNDCEDGHNPNKNESNHGRSRIKTQKYVIFMSTVIMVIVLIL